MSHKVLVPAATGLAGTEVVKALVENGVAVKAGSRSGTDLPGAETVIFSYDDPGTFAAALEGADGMFMLVPAEAVPRADDIVRRLVDAAVDAGVGRIVCMTGMSADQPGSEMYQVEQIVRGSGVEWTLLRPNWFSQNFAPGFYLEGIKAMGGLFVPAGDVALSFVDTRDIGAVGAAALTEDGHADGEYTLTGPESITHAEACAILSEASDRDITYTPISDDDLRGALSAQGMPAENVEGLVALYELARAGTYSRVSDDIENVLGRPAISFRQYAEDYADFLR